jgi:predicted flavoprotein YhiN
MRVRDLVVIGGGAAGMFAAASAASNGISVLLLEKMDRTGRKVRITGKGRCNITNTKPWQEFSVHIHPNPNFLKPSFFSFQI